MPAPLPTERLSFFVNHLGLTDDDLRAVAPFRTVFSSHQERYADYFLGYMRDAPETRRFVELERHPRLLWNNWRTWFARLFADDFADPFFRFLWNSGMRHVEMNVDQRFINLGYFVAKGYCRSMVAGNVAAEQREAVGQAVGKMLDFCLMVATDAFVTHTARCEREVMDGIAHQLRNPLAIIGGSLQGLKRKSTPDSPFFAVYETMFQEARRVERMVSDVGRYMALQQAETRLEPLGLKELLAEALHTLPGGLTPRLELDPAHQSILADHSQAVALLREVLDNAREAADPTRPEIGIASRADGQGRMLVIEVRNNGQPLTPEAQVDSFTPFASTKANGTGFGLPIARTAARKLHGSLELLPAPDGAGGAVCRIRLPLPPG